MALHIAPWYEDTPVEPMEGVMETVMDNTVTRLTNLALRDKRMRKKIKVLEPFIRDLAGWVELVHINDMIIHHWPEVNRSVLNTIVLNMTQFKEYGEIAARDCDKVMGELLFFSFSSNKDKELFMREWKTMFNQYGSRARKMAFPNSPW